MLQRMVIFGGGGQIIDVLVAGALHERFSGTRPDPISDLAAEGLGPAQLRLPFRMFWDTIDD